MSYTSALLAFAVANTAKYPALAALETERIGESHILKLTKSYGRYSGLVITFEETNVRSLRRRYQDYAVAYTPDYETACELILECAKWKPGHGKRK